MYRPIRLIPHIVPIASKYVLPQSVEYYVAPLVDPGRFDETVAYC